MLHRQRGDPTTSVGFTIFLTIRQEVEGMLQGMREAGTEMRIDEFGRDFNATDIHAINCYLEVRGEKLYEFSCISFFQYSARFVLCNFSLCICFLGG
jgi:hypothetical protein